MKPTHPYPRLRTTTDGTGTVSHAGGLLLTETVRATGLDHALSEQLTRWRRPRTVHDPAKTCTDLAIALALGGDHLADAALLRNQPDLYGPVASDPAISRPITTLAAHPDKAVAAIRTARATARHHVWTLADKNAPSTRTAGWSSTSTPPSSWPTPARRTRLPPGKRPTGSTPICAFADHGGEGTGEPLAVLLRPGNAGANTAADHITVTAHALRQLPRTHRRGRTTLIRIDTAGDTHDFLTWLTPRGRWLSYSVRMTITDQIHTAITRVPATAWTPAYDADGQPRKGA